ncbi:hypothetical protein M2315_001416 [Agrobacterium fabrum]|nr:hypothetical protein [Agrobacterium fabrum]
MRLAANVAQCVRGSRATVRFPLPTEYPKGLISLEIDRSLDIGRETSSSLNAHSAMPMSPRSWSARAATPFLSRTRAGTRGQSWIRSSERFRCCRHSRVRASHLIGAPSLPGSGLWRKGSVRAAGFATQARLGKKGPSRIPTSEFDASCQAAQTWQSCHSATFSASRVISTINRANALDTGRRPRCSWLICKKEGDPLP